MPLRLRLPGVGAAIAPGGSTFSVNGVSSERGYSRCTRTTFTSTQITTMFAARYRNASMPSTTAKMEFVTDEFRTTVLTYRVPKSCNTCHATAAATAPGSTSRKPNERAGAYMNTTANTAEFSVIAPSARARLCQRPVLISAPMRESTIRPTSAVPAVSSSTIPRSRALIGSGRWLRGTDQATFMAFCAATATPRPPNNAPAIPMVNPTQPPESRSG